MKIKLFIVILLLIHGVAQAQEFASIPEPTFYFDFQNEQNTGNPIFHGYKEVYTGNYSWPHRLALLNADAPRSVVPPRYAESAIVSFMKFAVNDTENESAYGSIESINFPYSIGPNSVLYKDDQGIKSLTMACWMWFSPTDQSNSKRLIFYGKERNAATLSVGLLHDNTGKISMVRSVNAMQTSNNYEVLYNTPVALDAGTGWYFVAFTQTEFTTRVFVGKPDNTFACQLKLQGVQDYSQSPDAGIGSPLPQYESVKAVDDLMIWQTALSADQLYHIYHCSHTQSPMTCWGGESGTSSTDARKITEIPIPVTEPPLQVTESMLEVYPNPSNTGNFIIDLTVTEDTPVELQIVSLQGSVLLQRNEQAAKGTHRFALNALDGTCGCSNNPNAGVYLLKVKTNQLSEVRRLVVQY